MSASLQVAPALDLLVQWEPAHSGKAAFYSGIDMVSGTVRVMGAGVWHGDDAERYFDQQRWIIDEARHRFGPLKVFFDVRGWIVENPQSALQFQAMNAEIYKPEDRLVALVDTSASKQHPRTALAVGQREAFISASAAETWLQAYSNAA